MRDVLQNTLTINPDALKVIKSKDSLENCCEPRGAQGDRVVNVMVGPVEDAGTWNNLTESQGHVNKG